MDNQEQISMYYRCARNALRAARSFQRTAELRFARYGTHAYDGSRADIAECLSRVANYRRQIRALRRTGW